MYKKIKYNYYNKKHTRLQLTQALLLFKEEYLGKAEGRWFALAP